jgi:REP-associated tyrosine transposase
MPRKCRVLPQGYAHHVFNRGNQRQVLFTDHHDYKDFLTLMVRARQRHVVGLLAYCLMPNHFHLVVRPSRPAALPAYMHWLTSTHVRRSRCRHDTVGLGHLYQERYKNVVIINDLQLIAVCRYVESNPLTACLVKRAEEWPYSSLGCPSGVGPTLDAWPLPKPANWTELVNTA